MTLSSIFVPWVAQASVIGNDDRQESVPPPPTFGPLWQDPLARAADATVALVDVSLLREQKGGRWLINGAPSGLCPGELFKEQPAVAFCSGVLIGPDRVLTAAHCLDSLACKRIRIVFDYVAGRDGKIPTQLGGDSVYSCANILDPVLNDFKTTTSGDRRRDLAVIKLDRPAAYLRAGRKGPETEPVPMSKSGASIGSEVLVIGHPMGQARKLSSGVAQAVFEKIGFAFDADTLEGSSGGPVFDRKTGALMGIVSWGPSPMVDRDDKQGCSRVHSYPFDPNSWNYATSVQQLREGAARPLSPGP